MALCHPQPQLFMQLAGFNSSQRATKWHHTKIIQNLCKQLKRYHGPNEIPSISKHIFLQLHVLGSSTEIPWKSKPQWTNPRTAVCPVICIAPMAFIEGFYKCLCWSAHFHPSIPDIPNIKEKYQEVQHCLEFQILKDTFCSLLHCLKLFWVATCKSINQYIWTSKYASCEWCPKNMNQRAIDRFQIKHSKSM